MEKEDLNHLANLLNTFLFEYSEDIQEAGEYSEPDKILASEIFNKIAELNGKELK